MAERNHRQNLNTQKRYEDLIKDVRRRKGYALTSPAELPRLEAEMQTSQALERTSWVDYTNAVNNLLVALRIQTNETVSLFIPPEIPAMPQLPGLDPTTMRAVKVAETNRRNAELNLTAVESQVRPTIDLVARARTTGSDPNHETARLEMGQGNHPTYFVGVELVAPLWSEANRGLIADARVQKMIAENDAVVAVDNTKRLLNEAALTAQARFEVVNLASTTVEKRERVVTEIERAYRQGRQQLVEVIRAYNDLSQARFDRATAVGNYNLALLRLSAARDELVKSAQ
ncbi:MAG: TolC family protein [Proteobacteria bacterium]|nr:MAG: TolC family protein [Pseudomonadota bacterium]